MMIYLLPVSFLSPFGLTNLKILGMGKFVCILKKARQLMKGVTCLYFKESLPINEKSDCLYFKESLPINAN